MAFDNLEKAEAAFSSAAYWQAKAVGDKYATFRSMPWKAYRPDRAGHDRPLPFTLPARA
jgi:hypothetical protein